MNLSGFGLAASQEDQQIDERVFAKLAHAFIQHTVQDGEKSSREVSEHLGVIQEQLLIAKYELEKVHKIGVSAKVNQAIAESLMNCLSEMVQATTTMQFFDRSAQRLEHASTMLAMIHDKDVQVDFTNVADGRRAMVRMYNGLSMEDERVLFQAIERGENMKKAVKSAQKTLKNTILNKDNIELF